MLFLPGWYKYLSRYYDYGLSNSYSLEITPPDLQEGECTCNVFSGSNCRHFQSFVTPFSRDNENLSGPIL
jgi:hypothetical protein